MSNFVKPKIVNVVMTSSLEQPVDITSFIKYGWGTYDEVTYGGVCGYFKTPDMNGKVSIFANGKMISVGSRNIRQAQNSLSNAKFHLLESNLIKNKKLKKSIRNIVATIDLKHTLDLKKIAKHVPNSEYNPEQFVGLVLKLKPNPSFLIYKSGKIIMAGTNSINKLNEYSIYIQKILRKI